MLLIVIDDRFFGFIFSFIFNHHLFFLPTVTRNQRNIRNNVKKTCFALFALGVVIVFVVSTCCRANSTNSSPTVTPELPYPSQLLLRSRKQLNIKKRNWNRNRNRNLSFVLFIETVGSGWHLVVLLQCQRLLTTMLVALQLFRIYLLFAPLHVCA